MHPYLLGDARLDDVQVAYMLMLGRAAESVEIAAEKAGRPVIEMLADFLMSDEMRSIAGDAVVKDRLAHDRHLGPEDHARVAAWLDRIAPMPAEAIDPSWWELLDRLLGFGELSDAVASHGLLDFRDAVMKRAKADTRQLSVQRPFLAFDSEWFLRFHEKARLALAGGIHDSAESYFLAHGLKDGLQLLPAFSHGLDTSYRIADRGSETTLGSVLRQVARDARSGKLLHWLFCENHYRDGLTLQDRRDRPDGAAALDERPLYLDFLTSGDGKRIGPHPLFCHYAYAKLNPDAQFRHGATFFDYVTTGCFGGLRTSVVFDDEFYLASNAEARYALLNGTHVSALHHFVTAGIFRDLPFSPDFEAADYRNRYPEIDQAIATGQVPSASHHFVFVGLKEGRSPNPYFNVQYYRARHPTVPSEMRRMGIRSELEHFLLVGKARGYKPERPLVSYQPAMDAAKAVFQRRARRSFNNVMRSPADFTAFAAKPALSVVVPVFNEVEFTARFVECAYFAAAHLKYATGLDCEVIVVDNGSNDGTDALLARCPGVVIASFDRPIGFPRAVNAGIRHARGQFVIVSNNDIEFAPDVFVKIHARLVADKSIGLLGGLTILPNETLQEAGSFLDSNAGVLGLGRLEDPWDAYFQGVHEADYCTGSFIAFRRSDYDALGGFDEDFSPGYYEETDFSFRLSAELGKVAAVDSSIQVSHFEHASFGKGRPPTTAYALIRRNQARFVDKHRQALSLRPSTVAMNSAGILRPTAIGRRRMLVIEDLIPDTRLGSGFVRSSQILAGLAAHDVAFDLLILNPSAVLDDYSDPRVSVYRAWMPGEDVATFLRRNAARYSHIMICRTHNLARFGAQIEALRHEHGIEIICDTEALSVLRVLETRRLAGRDATPEERRSALQLELDSPVMVSRWVAVSPYERDQIEAVGFGPVSVICHRFASRPAGTLPSFDARRRILAVGAIHEAGTPNHDGLLWFMDRILPQCRDAIEGLTLTVIGHWHPDVRESFASRYADIAIDFAGVVSDADLDRYYGEARLALAPTRFAAGVASKILEPMMLGVPVVMTDLLEMQLVGEANAGATGLAVGRRDDDGASFAGWVATIATDGRRWAEVQAAQYKAAIPLAGERAFDQGIQELVSTTGLAGSPSIAPTHALLSKGF